MGGASTGAGTQWMRSLRGFSNFSTFHFGSGGGAGLTCKAWIQAAMPSTFTAAGVVSSTIYGNEWGVSKGVSLREPGVLCTRNKAKGRRTVQSVMPVSKDNLVMTSFKFLFILSTYPELWGL